MICNGQFDICQGYGVAAAKNWRRKDELSIAILKFIENGQMDDLKRKWWKPGTQGVLMSEFTWVYFPFMISFLSQ